MAGERLGVPESDGTGPDRLVPETVYPGRANGSAMSDSRSDDASEAEGEADSTPDASANGADEALTTEELRARVEERYDFENFGPREMDEMSAEEWEAVFDPETWITGTELLDRVEADLKTRVLDRDVFARVERLSRPDRVVAYSDEGYVVVFPDGTIEGRGTVLRDAKPSVALCSMESYDPPPMPDGDLLPEPMEVPEGSGEFGNLMLQVVAAAQVLAGVALLGAALVTEFAIVTGVAGLGFLAIGVFLLFTVANTRLSDRFRAEEYRNRLRAVGLEDGERPDFLPESAREGADQGPPDDERDPTA